MVRSSKKSSGGQRAITRGKIRKLQRAGLLSERINPNKKPSQYVKSQFYKYKSVLSGRQAAVKLSTAAKARAFRHQIGGGGIGKVVTIDKEKGERFRVTKDDIVRSTRTAYGQTIEKEVGGKFAPPKPGEKIYYTLPKRYRGGHVFKRRTFASYDELLFFLSTDSGQGVTFEEIEAYIEVERFKEGSRRERQVKREYNEASRKLKSKRKRAKNKKRKTRGR